MLQIIPTTAFLLLLALVTSAGAAPPSSRPTTQPAYVGTDNFVWNYRIAHYLETATELQKLAPAQRAARLRELARNPQRASEVFPLCRMLFEAPAHGAFRRPMIGAPHFIDGVTPAGQRAFDVSARWDDLDTWPQEPIALVESVPILIVTGYDLLGQAETPDEYLEYCLKDLRWRDTKYHLVDAAELRGVIRKFIATNPKVKANADWLWRQAE